jgi:hemoglobin
MAGTMFERYGGFAAVSKVVMSFYDKVFDSDILAPYFEDVDMRRQIDHQTKFVSSVMGGPASYTNEALQRVHAHLDIDRVAFREMIMLFKEALEDMEFEDDDVRTVIADLESRAPFIIRENSGANT